MAPPTTALSTPTLSAGSLLVDRVNRSRKLGGNPEFCMQGGSTPASKSTATVNGCVMSKAVAGI